MIFKGHWKTNNRTFLEGDSPTLIDFSLFFFVTKKLMTSVQNSCCQHIFTFTLYRLFSNCIKLCWYYICSSGNLKGGLN